MKVTLSTTLDASAADVWRELRKTSTLRYVAAPILSFEPLDSGHLPEFWEEGTYNVRLLLFGVIPVGSQKIATSFPTSNENRGVYSIRDAGSGDIARVWDHLVRVEQRHDGTCDYMDEVEVKAGALTPIVWAFAHVYYRHRQHRWRRLARTLDGASERQTGGKNV